MPRRKSKRPRRARLRLIEHFVAGSTARMAAQLVGVNRPTAILYYRMLRETIAERVAGESLYTPKYGSWLNEAESELSVLSRQCLSCRTGSSESLRSEAAAWADRRNEAAATGSWRFMAEDARVKLCHLYPSIKT